MELVGDILKKTREDKKISLSNVSKELKISEEILRKSCLILKIIIYKKILIEFLL